MKDEKKVVSDRMKMEAVVYFTIACALGIALLAVCGCSSTLCGNCDNEELTERPTIEDSFVPWWK